MMHSGESSLTTSTGDTKSFDASRCIPRVRFSPHIGDLTAEPETITGADDL